MSKKHRAHRFTGRFLHWFYCAKCGLVRMKNAASQKAQAKSCDSDWEED